MASLGFFQTLQFATDIHEHLGKLRANRIERRMTRSLAAMTSSRNDAASNGAPRRDRPESRIFGTMVDAGSGCYLRTRDLPRLIALWPHELADQSPEGILLISCRSCGGHSAPSGGEALRVIGAMSSIATLA